MSATMTNTTMTTSVGTSQDHHEERGQSSAFKCFGRMAMLFVAGGAIAASITAVMTCNFFQLIATNAANPDTMDNSLSKNISHIGIFSYQMADGEDNNPTCHAYADSGKEFFQPNDWMGTMWIIAQYASLVAPLLGIVASLVALAELLYGSFCCSFLLPTLLFLLASISQGLTFFMYNEENVCFRLEGSDYSDVDSFIRNSCQLSFGAFLSITAGFCYYVCSVLQCCLPRPNYHCLSCCTCCKRETTASDDDTLQGTHHGRRDNNTSKANTLVTTSSQSGNSDRSEANDDSDIEASSGPELGDSGSLAQRPWARFQ